MKAVLTVLIGSGVIIPQATDCFLTLVKCEGQINQSKSNGTTENVSRL